MTATVLLTGSTDGIGLETAKRLSAEGHHVLLHGRGGAKLDAAEAEVRRAAGGGEVGRFLADLSRPVDVVAFAEEVQRSHDHIDVLINNAGVLQTPDPVTADGLDIRFAVNTIAPYILTRALLPLLGTTGRIVNLSSAAQAPVNPEALAGRVRLDASTAYAQSKLAITMWSNHLAAELANSGPMVVSVNPGSLLGTKMVREGYGTEGKDVGIGVDILARAALSEEFANASGRYFDNDSGRFANPHPDALDPRKNAAIVGIIESTIATVPN
jgi:NAD(P)-dependent dehydrogenase (short-subunit alcohol dehydrogenase family)